MLVTTDSRKIILAALNLIEFDTKFRGNGRLGTFANVAALKREVFATNSLEL